MLQHLPVWSISLSDYGGAAVISAPTDNHLVFRLHEFDENASVVRPSPVALPLGTASISQFHSLVYFSCVLLAQHRPSTSLSNKKPSLLFRVTNGHSLTIVIVATSLGIKKERRNDQSGGCCVSWSKPKFDHSTTLCLDCVYCCSLFDFPASTAVLELSL